MNGLLFSCCPPRVIQRLRRLGTESQQSTGFQHQLLEYTANQIPLALRLIVVIYVVGISSARKHFDLNPR